VWKSFDWDVMNRLHEKGFISDPVDKAKAVALTDEGLLESDVSSINCFLSLRSIEEIGSRVRNELCSIPCATYPPAPKRRVGRGL
jgi:hypothetical protein